MAYRLVQPSERVGQQLTSTGWWPLQSNITVLSQVLSQCCRHNLLSWMRADEVEWINHGSDESSVYSTVLYRRYQLSGEVMLQFTITVHNNRYNGYFNSASVSLTYVPVVSWLWSVLYYNRPASTAMLTAWLELDSHCRGSLSSQTDLYI